ncbi:MAG: glucuronate isomerase [Spirochaetota bacterium]|nr:glucuronate isomerase [Spirochaetota bacterium]
MKTFIDDDFMLQNNPARELYHEYASRMPIIDFHNHLPPREIAENTSYRSITEVWLGGDHYKWRAMRNDGIDEKYITGEGSDLEKFRSWAHTVPHTIGNPLYHWTHLELLRYFGIDTLLDPDSAESIYAETNRRLGEDEFRVRPLLEKMRVEVVCTTDDPADSLEYHRAIAGDDSFPIKVVPTFRPDKALAVDKLETFHAYLDRLGHASDIDISSYTDLLEALEVRHAFFHENGCRSSDHAFLVPVAEEYTEQEAARIFAALLMGESVTEREIRLFQTAVLIELARMNARRGWVMQLHIGALRNNNSRMFRQLGPDTGFDAMGDSLIAAPLARFLDTLNTGGELPRTVVYNLNPRDYEMLMSIIGCFHDGQIPGKMQLGSGWWFNDQKDGMERQMKAVANMGLLSRFIGMLTDSRSFLSFPRHEYFRRIVCNLIGSWVEAGEAPNDMKLLGEMVEAISYRNASEYFRIT